MNKTQIIDAVAKETGLKKKEAEAAVNAVFTTIEGALTAGEKVQLVGFGTFEVKEELSAPASTRLPVSLSLFRLPSTSASPPARPSRRPSISNRSSVITTKTKGVDLCGLTNF